MRLLTLIKIKIISTVSYSSIETFKMFYCLLHYLKWS